MQMQTQNEGESMIKEDSMMSKQDCDCEESMMMLKKDEIKEVKEDSAYRKVERVFKQKSDEKKANKRRKEDKKIVNNLLQDTIDFTTDFIPEKYSKIVEKVEFKDCPWKVYTLTTHKGFYFIVNPFKPEEQLHWISQCIDIYPQEPNITNLNHHYGSIKDIWKNAQKGEDIKYKDYLEKLSWATLGYQYAWTERKYEKEKFVPFPKDIGSLVTDIATTCGYGPYKPEAAIINFYSVTQCMGGHLDNAEKSDKPIVSISFGNSAIFLLGGEDRHSEPIPMLIRSGDVMIMGGRARFCFHGVPRILEETTPEYLLPKNVSKEYQPFCEYLESRRLNINTRQVYVEES